VFLHKAADIDSERLKYSWKPLATTRCPLSGVAHLRSSFRLIRVYNTSIRTSQETHYVSVTMPNRLMLFGKQSLFTVRTIRDTQTHFQIIHKNSVRTSQETHYVSATKPKRLMLFREIIVFYCENPTEHIIHGVGRMQNVSTLKQAVHTVQLTLGGS
jgi:hypothetical protein